MDSYMEELFKNKPRDYALYLIEHGFDAQHLLLCCLKCMSHDDVREMLDCNELSPRFTEHQPTGFVALDFD